MEQILHDCVKDSPKFRMHINEQEKQIDSFENSLEKLLKQSEAVHESGQIFHNANKAFMETFKSMATHYKEDSDVQEIIGTFVQTFTSCQSNYFMTLDNCNSFINRGLSNFLKTDVKRLKELRRHFLKMSDELESALVKNAQAYKSKDQDCDETSNQLQIARNNFSKAAMDYLFEINSIQMKKRTEILNMISNYVQNQCKFIEKNNENNTAFINFSNQVCNHLQSLQKQYLKERQIVREQIALLLKKVENQSQNGRVLVEPAFNENTEIRMEGYLFKRTSNAFKSWVSRRWFILEHNQLYYNSQSQDGTNPSSKKTKKKKVPTATLR